jgi:hypothetical protein
LIGLAIGDALGAPVEFKKAVNLNRFQHLKAGEVFNLSAANGQMTPLWRFVWLTAWWKKPLSTRLINWNGM